MGIVQEGQSSAFDLGDYVQVKDRIAKFYELYGGGRLVTTDVRTEMGPDGTPRVIVGAAAYRTVDDPHPGTGWSWMALPGTTKFTKGSELENTETSAWGRAIASLGILTDESIASAQEVRNKQDDGEAFIRTRKAQVEQAAAASDGSLIGIAKIGTKNTSDGELRETPDGWRLGFRLQAREGDRGGYLVEVNDDLAEAMAAIRPDWVDQPVTVWGKIEDRSFPSKGRTVTYQALVLSKIQTPTILLPGAVSVPRELTADEQGEIDGLFPEPVSLTGEGVPL